MIRSEAWDELSDEERADVSPLTRIRLGLPARPLRASEVPVRREVGDE